MTESTLLPPQCLEAEQATIGACLIDPGALLRAREIITAEDFYRAAHQRIFGVIERIDDAGDPVDVVTVGAVLAQEERLAQVGGGEYLTRLIGEVPTTAHVRIYARQVRDAKIRRDTIVAAEAVKAEAYAQQGSVRELLTSSLGRFQTLGEELASGTGARLIGERVDALQAQVEDWLSREPGIYGPRTGIGLVDILTGGMAGQGLVIVRALTKGLKSVWGMQVALTTARHYRDAHTDQVVLAYILEAEETWEQRALAWLGGFDGRVFSAKPGRGKPQEHEVEACGKALAELQTLPLHITADCNDIAEIELDVRQKAARHNVGLVLVDHLHRVSNHTHSEERLRLWDISRRLARLSDAIHCPVLCLAQAIERQDGQWYTKEGSAVDDEATLIFEIRRGDEKMKRHEWQSCPWFRLTCPTARKDQPFDAIGEGTNPPLYADLLRGDLRMMDERQWIERGHPVREELRMIAEAEAANEQSRNRGGY